MRANLSLITVDGVMEGMEEALQSIMYTSNLLLRVLDKALVSGEGTDAAMAITADDEHRHDEDEKAVTMSPDTSTIASRSSVSNDACCTADNAEHLSHQQVATTPSSPGAGFTAMQSSLSGQKSKEHLHLESRNIPVS